jgi:hypothetical protein
MGGPGKKTKWPPSQMVSSPNTSLAEPPVMARKSSVVPSSSKKTTSTKTAKVTPENPAGDMEREKTWWTEADNATMLQMFLAEKSAGNQSESGWKAGVYKLMAEELNVNLASRGPTDPGSIHNHFSRYEFNIFQWLVQQDTRMMRFQMKDVYKTIAALHEVSGFTWDAEDSCMGVNDEVWGKYVQV